eukprot:6609797-Lingulodinium_polyedra.AAC.1
MATQWPPPMATQWRPNGRSLATQWQFNGFQSPIGGKSMTTQWPRAGHAMAIHKPTKQTAQNHSIAKPWPPGSHPNATKNHPKHSPKPSDGHAKNTQWSRNGQS